MNDKDLHALASACYNGVPLVLVEVWPQEGDRVYGPGESERVTEPWIVTSMGPGEVRMHRGEPDSWGHRPDHASMRHSASFDGLFWCAYGERDGYSLHLFSPEAAPGSRTWFVRHLPHTADHHRDPEVHVLEVVSTTQTIGPSYRPKKPS